MTFDFFMTFFSFKDKANKFYFTRAKMVKFCTKFEICTGFPLWRGLGGGSFDGFSKNTSEFLSLAPSRGGNPKLDKLALNSPAHWRRLGGGFLLLLIFTLTLSAQESKEKNWTLQGYTKSMQGLFHINIPLLGEQTISDNFLHNRLNFNWYPSDNWTFKAGLRTRFFFGEFSKITAKFQN